MFRDNRKIELHNIVNTILSGFLLATAGFLYSANNQLIIITEKLVNFEKSLDVMDKKVENNIDRLNNYEIRNRK